MFQLLMMTMGKIFSHSVLSIILLASFCCGTIYPYKICKGGRLLMSVSKGECSVRSKCGRLVNCTTFQGSIIVREALGNGVATDVTAWFPALHEITGYLAIVHIYKSANQNTVERLFPNLAVIRGQEQILHYSLVIARTNLKRIVLPSLMQIQSGGVRIDNNERMCYVQTIHWRAIVLDTKQTNENFGISFYNNNEDCYDKCHGKCIAIRRHDNTRKRYCFGPGYGSNYECQKLCTSSCGSQGCVEGTQDKCCSAECSGGCTKANSTFHCHACKHYRNGPIGECVKQCPKGKFVVDKLGCLTRCPSSRKYIHNGECVERCPAGYTSDNTTNYCRECKSTLCPRECKLRDGFKISGLSAARQLKGCTNVIGNMKIEVRAGPDDTMAKLEQYLGSIRNITGYVEIRDSGMLTSLNFFKNLEVIQINDKQNFALLAFRNPNLKTLWTPRRFKTLNGSVVFQSNPYLCPNEIEKFKESFVGQISLSQSKNGYLAACNQMFNITVNEIPCNNRRRDGKCVNVTWVHDRRIDPRGVFYIVNYRIANKPINRKAAQDNCTYSSITWCQKDVKLPSLTGTFGFIPLNATISNLVAFETYSFFVETFRPNGDERKSGMVQYQLSEDIPERPIGVKASYLSTSAIEVTWRPPDNPHGNITEYRISFEKVDYSFWKSKINWCERDEILKKSTTGGGSSSVDANNSTGICPKNVTCNCGNTTEPRRVLEDRNAVIFNQQFDDILSSHVFPKNGNDDDDDDDQKKTKKPCSGNAGLNNCNTPPFQPPTLPARRKRAVSPLFPQKIAPMSPDKFPGFFFPLPDEIYEKVDGQTFVFIIKNLSYFQDYKITVCPCTKRGCQTRSKCATVTWKTGANSSADVIPSAVVSVKEDSYNVSWTPPPFPNGIVLRYGVQTRHNQNAAKYRCQPGHSVTAFAEHGAAPGNYSLWIRAITPAENQTWTAFVDFTIKAKETTVAPKSNAVIIGVGSTAAILILLLVLAIVYYTYVKKTASMGIPGVLYASVNPDYLNSNEVYVPDEWEVPRSNIVLIRELGKGSFGMVYEGMAHNIIEEQPKLPVAVKTVNEGASIRDRIEFLQEASIMKAFNCNHIVRLLGVVSQGQPTLVVMELMERGDLKGFLRSRRPGENNSMSPPDLAETLQMAAEIADGMSYLAARKFVHRDLAARNCMVAADFTVKIGDFGMTRDVYETDYYRKGGKGLLPVRWMAPESLRDGVFTAASDVWSYGVVLWEMATLATQPYPGKSNEDVLKFVIDGGVLDQPEECPDRLYNMMCNCWKTDERARPSFLEIVQFLENDVSDAFEEVSYYHEMKRKLLEAMSAQAADQVPVSHQARSGSNQMSPHVVIENGAASFSSESVADEDWKTEADRAMKGSDDVCEGMENELYAHEERDRDASVRYVEFPI